MSSRWHGAAIAVALLVLGAVAGCGGDDDATSSGAISKAEFIKEGNAICAKRGAQISTEGGRIIQQNSQALDEAQAKVVDQVIVPNFEAEIRELRGLGFPAGDDKRVEAVLAAMQSTIDRLRNAPPIRSSDSFKANHPYRPGEEIAAAYGLSACGHP